jgi:hypothetical protein
MVAREQAVGLSQGHAAPSGIKLIADHSELGPMARTSQEPKSTELVEERLCILQIGGVEALGEPAVHGREEIIGLGVPALTAPQVGCLYPALHA